ncbi:4'-phosphopantetheinyl transferase family protein [Streptomyces rimosus]|uniref:4'-phosphopantetheinyl transferase family protein n=1 Tax=Streptomyces rimosus TaxID=1927 RepID=UPI000517BFC9|nr:4'-phosphopantetheinyl transferase superfamily protein [Streptomyces rimosus]
MTYAGCPPDGTVHVWRIPLSAPPHVVSELTAVLDPGERERGERALPEERARSRIAHGAARLILGAYLGAPPERLRYTYGRWGKPALHGHPELCFNLSHSGGLALLAVASQRALGIDVERLPHPAGRAVRKAERWFPAEEAAYVRAGRDPDDAAARFTALWTRKEAWVKAAGGRMVQGLRLPVGPGLRDGDAVRDPEGRVPGRWSLTGVPVGDGYAAALAVAAEPGERPVRLEVRRWRRSGT